MRRSPFASILSWFGQGIGDVAILGGGRQSADGGRVRRSRNDIEESHVGDVVQVNLFLENYGQAPSVEAHGKHGGAEGQFANDGSPLVQHEHISKACPAGSWGWDWWRAHFCVLDDEVSRRKHKGNEGSREKHLNDRDIAIIAAKDLGKRVGVVDTKALGGAWQTRMLTAS